MKRGRYIIVSVVTLLLCVAAIMTYTISSSRRFTPERWQRVSAEARYPLAEDLARRKLLHGLSEAEIVGRLGKPERRNGYGQGDLNYYLGPERGWIAIDSAWLTIEFEDGKAKRVSMTTD